jgi:cytochrome c oxidase cbb3-type subunit 1
MPAPVLTAARDADDLERAEVDRSARDLVLLLFASAVGWLLVGSVLAILTSIKLHEPGFLTEDAWLTFGRLRPAHLNTVVYGWSGTAGLGVVMWLQGRLTRTRVPYPKVLIAAAVVWNLGVLGGTLAILRGEGTSVEWLEFPVQWAVVLAAAYGVFMAAFVSMFAARRQHHVYVSQWYLFGAIVWFPFVYVVANFVVHGNGVHGVAQSIGNWWFAHNVLGLWFTPIGLAAAYYFIPKILGKPIHSYHLSLLGFWTLALFYNWAGTHHLIGGPVPAWAIAIGIVGSLMMFVPVITVAINHHMTMRGQFRRLRESPTLRFVVFGAMSYTLVSIQGSLTAVRSINEVTHFTHYTIAHAHLGVYAFFTMIMFGAIYYIAPRLTGSEWRFPRLIRLHFWSTALGITAYFLPLTVGGILQGFELADPSIPFLEIVQHTRPWLIVRSLAGALLLVGHVAFAISAVDMFLVRGRGLAGPTLLATPRVP